MRSTRYQFAPGLWHCYGVRGTEHRYLFIDCIIITLFDLLAVDLLSYSVSRSNAWEVCHMTR
jgi:hypothetical protein